MTPGLNELMDEIADAPLRAVEELLATIGDRFFEDVCCVVEYELFRRHSRPELPSLAEFSAQPFLSQMLRALDRPGDAPWQRGLQSTVADVVAIPTALGSDVDWTAFKKRSESTARAIGFSDLVASAIAGAIHEMADNIVQHSQAERSGVAAFRATGNRFEYVVGDAGIGILESLRRAAEFQGLRDDIEALSLAVLPGVSRFGRESGRGYGFRAVFIPLKGAEGAVRLRSGRAVLSMHGTTIAADRGVCAQRANHRGVVVAVSVTARH
jgi:hypothetical protein